MSFNAGGAATNAGIDFQSRISAIFLTHMLMDVVFIDDFGMTKDSKIQSLQFESDDAIDDLVVRTDLGTTYIQAKRSINFSDKTESEFSKVVKQFVNQHFRGVLANDTFVLATSTKASSKIIRDLRKITESVRLNGDSFANNPLNQSEKFVYTTLVDLIGHHYGLAAQIQIDGDTVRDILGRMYVSVIDIEQGMPMEKAVLTLISGQSLVSADLLWSSLISLGLSLSKERASINQQGLEERVGRFVGELTHEDEELVKKKLLRILSKGMPSSGKELFIAKSFDDTSDYMLVELPRFRIDGERNVVFYEDIADQFEVRKWHIIFRCSSFAGIARYMEKNEAFFKDKRLAKILLEVEEDFDQSYIALAHSQLCELRFNNKSDPLACIRCGDPISLDRTLFVEIDERDSEHDVGYIHNECVTPIDRVLGIVDSELFRANESLVNFDYEAFYRSLSKGQGFFTAMSSMPTGVYPVAWKPDYNNISKGKYCIKINLEDGSSRYVQDRGRVTRETQDSAEKKCQSFSTDYNFAKENNDPFCYSSKNGMFGNYSVVSRLKEKDEECLLCVSAEVVAFTNAIHQAYSSCDRFYSPLITFLEKESGSPIILNGAMLMISSPLNLERYLNNWSRGGIELPEYTLTIIESDEAFDILVTQLLSDGIAVFIDPEIDMNGQLTAGLDIQNLNELVDNPEQHL